jgi:hypothetical protein
MLCCMKEFILAPVSFKDACAFVNNLHRHHIAPQGWKFGLSAWKDNKMVAVAMVGRPVARGLDDGYTLEITRLCSDGTYNACSFLYSACARTGKALAYKKIITYILKSEPGTSLKAANWKYVGDVKGRSWSCPSRLRTDKAPTVDKERWEFDLSV